MAWGERGILLDLATGSCRRVRLDIAGNLGWLCGRGSFEERRLLVETLFQWVEVQGERVVG